MLIAVRVVFPFVIFRSLPPTLPEVTLVLDRVLVLTFLLAVPLVATEADAPVESNGGALLSGWGLFAPAPANVPVVLPLPPKPV